MKKESSQMNIITTLHFKFLLWSQLIGVTTLSSYDRLVALGGNQRNIYDKWIFHSCILKLKLSGWFKSNLSIKTEMNLLSESNQKKSLQNIQVDAHLIQP